MYFLIFNWKKVQYFPVKSKNFAELRDLFFRPPQPAHPPRLPALPTDDWPSQLCLSTKFLSIGQIFQPPADWPVRSIPKLKPQDRFICWLASNISHTHFTYQLENSLESTAHSFNTRVHLVYILTYNTAQIFSTETISLSFIPKWVPSGPFLSLFHPLQSSLPFGGLGFKVYAHINSDPLGWK